VASRLGACLFCFLGSDIYPEKRVREEEKGRERMLHAPFFSFSLNFFGCACLLLIRILLGLEPGV